MTEAQLEKIGQKDIFQEAEHASPASSTNFLKYPSPMVGPCMGQSGIILSVCVRSTFTSRMNTSPKGGNI